jgi:hypothetical protein
MSGNSPKQKARTLVVAPSSRYALLQKLILEGFFDAPVSSGAVVLKVKERFGKSWKTLFVQTYMQRFMQTDIIHAVKPTSHKGNYWVLTSMSREQALRMIGKKRKVLDIEEELFSDKLQKRMRKNFDQELEELRSNFGANGNCTAFLLRKILEKLIIIVISKCGKGPLLEDKSRPGGWVGLRSMIEIAAREKLNGVPFLIPKTADEIKGVKFLGDTAAHNPLIGVDSRTILPQMPFIITAYEELAKRL